MKNKTIKVKLVKSPCGRLPAHRKTVRALGLTRLYQERTVVDNECTRGMVNAVPYLVKIVEG